MNRQNLIQKLVDRKIASNINGKAKNFCICMARKLCIAAAQPAAAISQKK